MSPISSTPLILGIETSCDETAAAVVGGDKTILSNCIYSQIKEHQDYQGVVPEIAARSHLDSIQWIVQRALDDANVSINDITAVAATTGPGLIGGVLVGMQMAKALSYSANIPFLGINHLEGHALTARLTNDVEFPFLLLLVSGGHTQLLLVKNVGKYEILGTTLDDAVGEAFDKTAKLLDIGYPGGPILEQRAQNGDPNAFDLPRPMKGKKNCDFSFSGLKTRVRHLLDATTPITPQTIDNMCASFQTAVAESLCDRVQKAMEEMSNRGIHTPESPMDFVVAGGVAANATIKKSLHDCALKNNFTFACAPATLCTDNAVMIAWAGFENYRVGTIDSLDKDAKPRWSLEDIKR